MIDANNVAVIPSDVAEYIINHYDMHHGMWIEEFSDPKRRYWVR